MCEQLCLRSRKSLLECSQYRPRPSLNLTFLRKARGGYDALISLNVTCVTVAVFFLRSAQRTLFGVVRRLCTKMANLICFSLRPLRISAFSALKGPINAENAEIRRGPQRKDFHLNSIFCAK